MGSRHLGAVRPCGSIGSGYTTQDDDRRGDWPDRLGLMQLRLRPTAGSGRQRRVIQLRFGLLDRHMRALEEVARRLGTSRETVRQLEHEALAKLRLSGRAERLRAYAA